MRRIAATICLAAAAGAALFLFQLKHEVRILEERLRATHEEILDHQEAIHVLATEWSYLNQPARLADLASRHLGLSPLTAEQVVRLEDLPGRASAALPTGADGKLGGNVRPALVTAKPGARTPAIRSTP